jgi:hypothetical protein
MSRVPLRTLLSKLTVLALSTSAVAATAAPLASAPQQCSCDRALDGNVPIDREHVEASAAASMLGRSLANALAEVSPLAATHLATTWALSEDPLRRAAVARSLEWTFPLLADSVIIDHLSRDPDAEIRAASARAAWVRRTTGGDAGVLDRLVHDSDADVRSIALRARHG